MMSISFISPGAYKELRALAPMWIAVVALIGAGAAFDTPVVVLATLFGSIALAAHAIGHEYQFRTLPVLLSQPVHRRRLLLNKACVAAPMVASLVAIAAGVLGYRQSQYIPERQMMLVLFITALCLAPLLTMLARNTLAGVVFAFAIPALLWLSTDLLAIARYGLTRPPAMQEFKVAVFTAASAATSGLAALLAMHKFLHLEAIDGAPATISLPRWLGGWRSSATDRSEALRRRPAAWLLLKKELRIQQLPLVVAAIFVGVWMAAGLLDKAVPALNPLPLGAITQFYFGLLTILIGALACAEERHFGTLDSQRLLPVPSWKQWMVKAGVALGLAFLLGLALPLLLRTLLPPPDSVHMTIGNVASLCLLTALALYISSIAPSGIAAFTLTVPVVFGGLLLVRSLWWTLARAYQHVPRYDHIEVPVVASASALLLWLAFLNHRSGDRSMLRIVPQGVLIVIALTIALLVGV